MNKVSIPKLHSYRLKNMENVHVLDTPIHEDIHPINVLVGAIDQPLDKVIVCGVLKDGEGYYASNIANIAETTHLLQRMLNALTR